MNDGPPSRIPRATYRLQINHRFTFEDAAAVAPYLTELGISDLYASPYLHARPGSLHGYDIVDHEELNPELGGAESHAALARSLREHGLGHLLDIVPNHMGIAGGANAWWNHVLEHGPSSPYAAYFDIDWRPLKPELAGKVLLPVLGDQYGTVLEAGELRLEHQAGRFGISYHEHRFPVAPRSRAFILQETLERVRAHAAEDDPARMELESILASLLRLPRRERTDPAAVTERLRESEVATRRLRALLRDAEGVRVALEQAVEAFNGTPGDPHSFDLLDTLLADQAYRLAFWRVAAEEINYRRFFDINDLAGVRVERPEVFRRTHALVLRLVSEGIVTGLRVDHPDGLYDPTGYLQGLARAAREANGGEPVYLLAEKILTGEEELPEEWPVAGTVGYDFLARVNGLFVARENAGEMLALFRGFTDSATSFPDLVYEKKKLILRSALASELNVLANLLSWISERDRRARDFTLSSLLEVLRETIACFPVYRTYIDPESGHVSERDRVRVEEAIRRARRRNRSTARSLFDFLRDTLLLRWPDDLDEEARAECARFVMKFQQLTGPVTAKGVEDTAFYLDHRLVSLNEVGGEPDHFGFGPDDFHAFVAARAERWPHAMNATSTHDTKRSEDVRARINVLSELPEAWRDKVTRWATLNAAHLTWTEGERSPSAADEYLLYQTLVGAWPLEEMDAAGREEFTARMQAYLQKAAREAKQHTSWINPDEEYDAGLHAFVERILDPERSTEFLADLVAFQQRIAPFGMANSLAQTLVKLTAPGVPDLYQGQELWDLSLVDPDNRRPVDFEQRRELLRELREAKVGEEGGAPAAELLRGWRDGRLKLHLTHRALELRARRAELFSHGAYTPLRAEGPAAEHLLAFTRTGAGTGGVEAGAVLTVIPLRLATLAGGVEEGLPQAEVWRGTRLRLPPGSPTAYRSALTGERVEARGGELEVAELLSTLPVGLLEEA